jgi:molybdopterin molybdotransferase
MISVTEARKIISDNVSSLEARIQSLQHSAGLTLAEDIYASMDMPPFPQSSMDGYAFSFADWQRARSLKIIGESAAGIGKPLTLQENSAMRIFTGAPLPDGADTVVMQEKVKLVNGELIITDEDVKPGTSVRPKGSEIKAGVLALKSGTVLTPAAIGFLAGIGLKEIKVFPNPSITIIITGNELQDPGKPLSYGQVYESNSFALGAVLKQLQIDKINISYAGDKMELVEESLEKALKQSDIVLLTGGISVGDYDFVLSATEKCGVQKLFHKVKQRPGKPLYFGKKGNKLVFGLPGNPSSVLTCFYQYVIPALEKLSQKTSIIKMTKCPLARAFQKNTNLTHFLKGIYDGKTATVLDAQESFRLSSFAVANCLIQIDEEVSSVKEGEMVNTYLLPV